MSGQTNYITEVPWTDTITTWYVHINDAYNRLISKRGKRLRARGPEPKFSDSEVITVSLIIETFFQGHEEVGYSSMPTIRVAGIKIVKKMKTEKKMSRPKSREKRKKAFMQEAEKLFDEMDNWYDKNPDASFEDIENRARIERREMMGKSLGVLINGRDVGKTLEAPDCDECEKAMTFKDYREKMIYGIEGDTVLERAYYVCDNCEKQTLFPPR